MLIMQRQKLLLGTALVLLIPIWVMATDPTSILIHGSETNKDNRIIMAIVGDGFTADYQNHYNTLVNTYKNKIFSTIPFSKYSKFFNLYRINAISNDLGIGSGSARDTALGMYTKGLTLPFNSSLFYDVLDKAYGPGIDFPLVVGYTYPGDTYAGSAWGNVAKATDTGGYHVLLHELGHTIVGLADEYNFNHCNHGPNGPSEPGSPNISAESDATKVKWKHWTGYQHISTYEGGGYCKNGIYRNHPLSKMFNAYKPFYEVNSEAFALKFYEHVDPIDSISPSNANTITSDECETLNFSVDTVLNVSDNKIEWFINDEKTTLSTNATLSLDSCSDFGKGSHTVKVKVTDDVRYSDGERVIRKDPNNRSQSSRSWTVVVNASSSTPPANRQPTAVGRLSNVTVQVGGTGAIVDISNAFTDPDGDTLTYSTTSLATDKATVVVARSSVVVMPVATGSTTVTVTATDTGNLSATQTFSVTVNPPANRPPTAVGRLSNVTVQVGGTGAIVDISNAFTDPDGDTLTYSTTSLATDKATVVVARSSVVVMPVATGSTTVTVTATDTGNLSATQTFSVTVNPPAPSPTPPTEYEPKFQLRLGFCSRADQQGKACLDENSCTNRCKTSWVDTESELRQLTHFCIPSDLSTINRDGAYEKARSKQDCHKIEGAQWTNITKDKKISWSCDSRTNYCKPKKGFLFKLDFCRLKARNGNICWDRASCARICRATWVDTQSELEVLKWLCLPPDVSASNIGQPAYEKLRGLRNCTSQNGRWTRMNKNYQWTCDDNGYCLVKEPEFWIQLGFCSHADQQGKVCLDKASCTKRCKTSWVDTESELRQITHFCLPSDFSTINSDGAYEKARSKQDCHKIEGAQWTNITQDKKISWSCDSTTNYCKPKEGFLFKLDFCRLKARNGNICWDRTSCANICRATWVDTQSELEVLKWLCLPPDVSASNIKQPAYEKLRGLRNCTSQNGRWTRMNKNYQWTCDDNGYCLVKEP